MKHEFTDDQLRQAVADFLSDDGVDLGVSAFGDFFWTQQVRALRKMFDALPDPAADDWQECGFNDFRPTDKRVKAVFIGGSIIEGTPDRRNGEHVFLVDGPVIHSYDDATFYRIPAPVQHPDPKKHPVILVNESVNTEYDPPEPMIWDGGDFYESPKGSLHINTITKFTPAKVVADDDPVRPEDVGF